MGHRGSAEVWPWKRLNVPQNLMIKAPKDPRVF